ncbi:MAG: polyphosphate kinase 2 family protein [Planctomycetes bacterium]|nr:polyphosphate kinase 2 family protein [Planctomycetota bacterium]
MPHKKKSADPTSNRTRRRLQKVIADCRVEPGEKSRLSSRDAAWAGSKKAPKSERKNLAEQLLSQDVSDLAVAQELLYASNSSSVLLIFQAMDAAGKDSTIRHVMSGVNPQGCQVYSFKQPSPEELDHNFLWRCMKALPEHGRIGIFNRSYYEEVLVVRVHPELLVSQHLSDTKPTKEFWQSRYDDINHFEQHLVRNGTVIVKFFLNVSKEEQRKRFLERIDRPEKHWKFSASDTREREHWDDYMRAYEQMLTATSTEWAPWYVIPADNKWITRALVANIIASTIRNLHLSYPTLTPEQERELKAAGRRLRRE